MGRIEGRTVAVTACLAQDVPIDSGEGCPPASHPSVVTRYAPRRRVYFGAIALHAPHLKWAVVYAFVFILVALGRFPRSWMRIFTLSAAIGFWPATILSATFFGYSHR
jgi:hypothetical protein